jgi:hypothetical protein
MPAVLIKLLVRTLNEFDSCGMQVGPRGMQDGWAGHYTHHISWPPKGSLGATCCHVNDVIMPRLRMKDQPPPLRQHNPPDGAVPSPALPHTLLHLTMHTVQLPRHPAWRAPVTGCRCLHREASKEGSFTSLCTQCSCQGLGRVVRAWASLQLHDACWKLCVQFCMCIALL